MGSLATVVRMVAQRSLGHWKLFAAMATGAILCSALMACVILYSDAVRDLGLSHALESQPPYALDIRQVSTSQRFSGDAYAKLRGTTDQLLDQQTANFRKGTVHFGRSATFFPTGPGEPVAKDDNRPRANLQFLDDLLAHIHIIEGAAPAPFTTGKPNTPPPVVEALLSKKGADLLGVKVGQEFDLNPHWRPVVPVRIRVSGIVEPNDLNEPYWFGQKDRFELNTTWPTLLFFVDEQTLIKGVGGYLPDMDGSIETFASIDTSAINSGNAKTVESAVAGLRGAVSSQLTISYVETTLDTTIKSFREKLFFTRLPLFALMIQIVGIVLFYLVMVSTMVVERQSGEIALLKSRGAGTPQVMTVFLIEGLGIMAIATIAGPFLASGAISLLGLTPPFQELSNGDLLKVPLTPLSFALALGGGLLALGALLWPAYRACGFSITHYKQQISRPPRQSAFLRYYLDLVLVGVAAFAFYQLRQKGSFVTESLFGDLSADPILLATPSLFMLMAALVFLRVFPLALRLVLRVSSTLKGPTISLGLTRMARSPLQHSRLILLLILATAVGMFAAGFRSTLERGYEDRAAYKAGAEGRLTDIRQPAQLPDAAFRKAITEGTGGADVCPVTRLNSYFSPTLFQSVNVTLLGVCGDQFKDLPSWRSDFASDSLNTLLDKLKPVSPITAPAPVVIPANARYLGLWAQMPLPANFAPMGVRLRDSDGGLWEYRLVTEGPNVADTWQFFVTDLSRPTSIRPSGVQPAAADRKWVFDSFFIALPGAQPQVSQTVNLPIDDLQTSAAASLAAGWGKAGFADGTVIETFESIDQYELLKGVSAAGDPGQLARGRAPAGRQGAVARISFIRGRTGSPVVAFRTLRDSSPLRVLANSKFLDKQGKKVGDTFPLFINSQYSTVVIAGRFDLFPTYDPASAEAFLVADGTAVQRTATRIPGAGSNVYANEAWLLSKGSVPIQKEALKAKGINVEQVFDREQILAEQSSDPLVAASWEGILFLAFAGVLLVSALGFVTYAGLGAQARSLEFAILRTMGLSARQIFSVVTFEQAFVVIAGMAAGTLLGFPLSRLMISYMGLTENGKDPLPPLLSVVNWQSVITVWLLLGIVVVSTVISLVALYSRLAVSRALRMGEL